MGDSSQSFDEVLDKVLFDSIVMIGVRDDGTVTDLDTLIIDRRKAVAAIRQAVRELVEGIIGEDEPWPINCCDNEGGVICWKESKVKRANELRAEQRTALLAALSPVGGDMGGEG